MLYDKADIQSIFNYAKENLEGKKLKEIGSSDRLFSNTKGGLGQFIEEEFFGYQVNSRSEPDFNEAGLELKVTPFKTNKNGSISSKERLVLNIINYEEEVKKSFDESSFWLKNNNILMVFYEWLQDVSREEYEIKKVILYQYPEEDLIIIKQDWEKIVNKIRNGKAETISEGDTLYLGACTKGVSKYSLRSQPFSEVLAKQRAYSFKRSYMDYILNSYAYGNKKSERIIKDYKDLEKTTLEDYIINTLSKYYGKTKRQLKEEFCIENEPKQIWHMVASRILGLSDITKSEEFEKANIEVKTIRIETSGRIEQSMSFPSFKFKEIIHEDWEESTLRTMFFETKFLFFITQKTDKGEQIFIKAQFWNMPIEIIDGPVYETWIKTIDVLNNGVELIQKNGKIYNNFPGIAFNKICHVRPHTNLSSYEKGNSNADELPDGRWMTKQCFWLNNTYIRSVIDI